MPDWEAEILRRLAPLKLGPAREAEIAEEIAQHLEDRYQELLVASQSEDVAYRTAIGELKSEDLLAHSLRAVESDLYREPVALGKDSSNLFAGVLQDLHYALRMLRKSPGFTAVAVLTLAVGIGANTAIFSLLNAVLIRSLPYADPGQLVYVFTPSHELPQIPIEALGPSNGDFFDIQRQARSFSAITLFDQRYFNLAAEGMAQRVSGVFVQSNFFPTLGVSPLFGRAIQPADTEPGREHVANISYALWQSAFGGSTQVLGKSVTLDGQIYQVIGVMPASFGFPSGNELPYSDQGRTQVWLPLALTPLEKTDRENPEGNVVARLRPGVSLAHAQAEMNTIMPRLDPLHASYSPFRDTYCVLRSCTGTVVGGVRLFVWLLFGAVCLVLLVACANAANLLFARAATRTHEMGIRAALGAHRGRLIRQVLTEALLLASTGGAVGVLIAYAAIRLLLHLNPGNIPRLGETSLDLRVLLFAVAISMLAGVIFGILPALGVSRTNLTELLKQGGNKGVAGVSERWRHSLIVGEVALAVVLLTGSGLLIRSYVNLQNVSTGFSASTLTMHIALDSRYSGPEQRRAFFRNVLDKLGELHGVTTIGAISDLPLSHSESMSLFMVEGYANKKGQAVDSRFATENYFDAIGTALLAGRSFTPEDGVPKAPGVVIVNESFAKEYFSGRSAMGGHFAMGYVWGATKANWSTVVGVVANTRHSNLEDAPPPQVYTPFWQQDTDQAYIAISSSLPPAQMIPAIRSAVGLIDPTLAVSDIETMDQRVSEASALRRFQTSLFAVFAAVALFLAAIGLYGVMAYSVRQRTPEIGIRLALGARPSNVLKLVVAQVMILTVLGILLGLGGTFALTRLLSSLLYGIAPSDPATFTSVAAVLLAVSLLAGCVPARRAMRVDPVVALRYE
ncbi:MAG TPA: ABC transporter permease [Candidatus Solibacter sp.]|nr:ABC transporter permease [Candidatus Solibacter sp.]